MVEDGVEVDELEQGVVRPDLFGDCVVFANEVAVDKVFQDVAEVPVVFDLQVLCKLFAGIAFLGTGEGFDDGFVFFGFLEDGFVETVVLLGEDFISLEEKSVDILRQAEVLVEEAEVVRNPAESHIGLKHGHVRPAEAGFVKILFRFSQRKRIQVLFVGDAVMKSAFVVYDVADNPGGGAATDNEQHVFLMRAPAVPEIIQSLDKTGLGRSQAGQFINEYDHPTARDFFVLQQCPEVFKGGHPCAGFASLKAIALERSMERGQLLFLGAVNDAGGIKGVLLFIEGIHQEGLAYPPPSVNGYELGVPGVVEMLKFFYFRFAAD